MPSLNRPNAPSRLPSADIENSFFRGWTQRSSSTPGWSLPSSTGNSSPASPTSTAAQRKARKARFQSEGSAKTPIIQEVISTSIALGSVAPTGTQEGASSLKFRASSNSTESEPSSSRSSISSRARRLFNIPTTRKSGIATKPGNPRRDARKGFTWQHEISGHWLEIPNGKRRRSDVQSQTSEETTTERQAKSPAFITKMVSTANRSVDATPDDISQHISSLPLSPKEGLYFRTKRRLGLNRNVLEAGNSESRPRTMTGEVLERTASMLRLLAERIPTTPSTSTSGSNLSIAATRWRLLQPSRSRRGSSSSSIRSLMMGKPPTSTPEAQEMYTGSDEKQYFTVELTDTGAPTFLPSEAKRIKTPPLRLVGSGKSKVRGFFFDYNAPPDDELWDSAEKPSASGSAPLVSGHRERRVSETEWYRVKLEAIEAEALSREHFVLQVPDHLPNSPLCPKHPRHKSGGTGICPVHGRSVFSASTTQSPMLSPDADMDAQTHNLRY